MNDLMVRGVIDKSERVEFLLMLSGHDNAFEEIVYRRRTVIWNMSEHGTLMSQWYAGALCIIVNFAHSCKRCTRQL